MPSKSMCCLPNCNVTHEDKIPLHTFPNPEKEPDRFRSWLYAIDGDLLSLDNHFIYKYRRVCHNHFETKYHTWTRTLSPNAVPTLNLPGLLPVKSSMTDITNVVEPQPSFTSRLPDMVPQPTVSTGLLPMKRPMKDITNVLEPQPSASRLSEIAPQPTVSTGLLPVKRAMKDFTNVLELQPSTSRLPDIAPQPTVSNDQLEKSQAQLSTSQTQTKPAAALRAQTTKKKDLYAIIKKMTQKKESYAERLKKALKLSENKTFQNCLKKFTTLAAIFTVMQFREISKNKMARRFTQEEKIMALSFYKQGPRSYRLLRKAFVLPSPLTLSRLVSRAGLKPGINKNIFLQLKKRVQRMSNDEKICLLMFDEISITPHFDFNRKKDLISGFVNDGINVKREIADHALVFMLRGIVKNYKVPLAYTFCKGTTPKDELKRLIRMIITEMQGCGLKVLATVCDQGSTNVSAINSLIQDTRAEYLRRNQEYKHELFEINGEEITPLFDPPHLIKGIRNNLLTKNLKCYIENEEKTAKWDHIMHLHNENPGYKGLRLVKNLTEAHVNPKKISKMKVKLATQIFSKTVATNMGYLADKGILPQECKGTADILLFFDELFDSMNGSYYKAEKKSAKPLLGPVTPKSEHNEIWKNARKVLSTMKFVTKNGNSKSVPSITNWIRTLDNVQHLKDKLFNDYNVKSFWMRHFNQDPLENFFGCIRSHGYRNTSPTPAGFEAAFASLLISKITNHSPSSNCEEDYCKSFELLSSIFSNNNHDIKTSSTEINMEDLECDIVSWEIKKRDPKLIAQLSYVSGYVLRQGRKNVFKNCENCNKVLNNSEKTNEYISRKEYFKTKGLTYPSEEFIIFFSGMQDIINSVLEKRSHTNDINNYCKTVVHILLDCNFINCQEHRSKLLEFIVDFTCRFFICNWCRDVNYLLSGNRTEYDVNDQIKKLANKYYTTRNKK